MYVGSHLEGNRADLPNQGIEERLIGGTSLLSSLSPLLSNEAVHR